MNKTPIIECQNLAKAFADGKHKLHILEQVNLKVAPGAQIAIMGRSGSGKSTLLQLLGGLDHPSHGKVLLAGQDLARLSNDELSTLRNKSIGFVYQMHHLLAEFSALENIALPLLIAKQSPKQALDKAAKLLSAVGLSARANHRPGQLSGGERQRVAIARALANDPDCVLADEPTGNLDAETAEATFQLLREMNKERGVALIIVTHDVELAKRMDDTYYLKQGSLVQ